MRLSTSAFALLLIVAALLVEVPRGASADTNTCVGILGSCIQHINPKSDGDNDGSYTNRDNGYHPVDMTERVGDTNVRDLGTVTVGSDEAPKTPSKVSVVGGLPSTGSKTFDLTKAYDGLYTVLVDPNSNPKEYNTCVSPHVQRIRSAIEGGPAGLHYKEVEFPCLRSGTDIFDVKSCGNGFYCGYIALRRDDLAYFGRNLMHAKALEAMIVGVSASDPKVVVLEAYYLNTRLLGFPRHGIPSVADRPWVSRKDQHDWELREYEEKAGRPLPAVHHQKPDPAAKMEKPAKKDEPVVAPPPMVQPPVNDKDEKK